MTRLGDVLLDVKPGFASRDDLDEGVFQFRMHNFTRESSLDLSKRRRVKPTRKQIETQSVGLGDVLFNSTNSPEMVGKSALIADLDEPAVFSNHFMRLRVNPDRLHPSYLAHFLRHQFELGVFRGMAKAWVNQATVGRDRLEDLHIPLLPLDEQRRVAAILDHADALRAKRLQVRAELGALTEACFWQQFGDPLSGGKGWPRRRLGDIARIVRGASPRPAGDPRYFGGPVPWLKIADITAEPSAVVRHIREGLTEAGRDRSVLLPPETLVLTNSATVGIPKIIESATCIHDGFLAFLDLDPVVDKFWLRAALDASREKLIALAPEGTQKNLNGPIVKALEVSIPPLREQEKFVRKASAVAEVSARMRDSQNIADELFASLQYRAFRGEL